MTTRSPIIASLFCLLAIPAPAADKSAAKPEPFEVASVRFEQNATDGDVETVFEAIGNDDGLAKLSITAPDGHTIVEFTSPAKSSMGIREFHFESPEPTDVAALKRAFPEGKYKFTAVTSTGAKLESDAMLSHKLPPATSFVFPKPDARDVPINNLKVSWAPVKGVAGYTLELNPSNSSSQIEVKLPASTTSFAVPEGLLVPGGKCQIGIGTVSSAGNASVIETDITMATSK